MVNLLDTLTSIDEKTEETNRILRNILEALISGKFPVEISWTAPAKEPEKRIRIDQKSKSKASSFTDWEVDVHGYKLIQIATDGDLTDISYKVQNWDYSWTPEIEASLTPHIIGTVRKIRINNDTGETGKTVFVHLYSGSDQILNLIRHGSPKQVAGVVGIKDAGDIRINPAKEDGNLAKLDVKLTEQAKYQRWGRNLEPEWVHSAEVTAPAAATNLVSKTVGTGKSGYIYGFLITAGEPNDFKLNWTSGGTAYSIRIVFSSKGSLETIDNVALNEGLPADAGSSITIQNVNAGAAGIVYQARLLYVEV